MLISGNSRVSTLATDPKLLDTVAAFDLGDGLAIEVTISPTTGLPTKVGWRSPTHPEVRPLPANDIVRIAKALEAIAESCSPDDHHSLRTAVMCVRHGLSLAATYEARCPVCDSERLAAEKDEAAHG